jgi:hypothetical protein
VAENLEKTELYFDFLDGERARRSANDTSVLIDVIQQDCQMLHCNWYEHQDHKIVKFS